LISCAGPSCTICPLLMRREPFERLIQQDDFGVPFRARAIASICCSPPDRSVPRLPRLLEPRKYLVNAVERPAPRRGQSSENKVFLDVQAAKNPALFVHELHAHPRNGVTFSSCDIDAVEHHGAGARRQNAHQALQSRALAAPLPPSSPTTSLRPCQRPLRADRRTRAWCRAQSPGSQVISGSPERASKIIWVVRLSFGAWSTFSSQAALSMVMAFSRHRHLAECPLCAAD
jgi:hypothetical protein